MKHAKRMILVPEDVYARFEQKQKLETSPIMKNMINTDTDMTDILKRTDVDDTEKQKLYYANLNSLLKQSTGFALVVVFSNPSKETW